MKPSIPRKIKFGIRVKAIVAITILVILVATILSIFFIKYENKIIHGDLKQMGLVLSSNLAYNAEYGVLTDNLDVLKSLIEGIVKQPHVAYCLIHDVEGNILVSRGIENKVRGEFYNITKVALSADKPVTQLVNIMDGKNYYDIAVPIITKEVEMPKDEMSLFEGGEYLSPTNDLNIKEFSNQGNLITKKIGIARVGLSLAGASVLEQESRKIALIIAALIILISGVITTVLTGVAVNPIKRLVEGTQRIAKGDLNFQVAASGDDEVAQLADSFNTMTEDLRKSHNELISAKEYTDNIIKSMVDILIVVDPKGKIRTVNPATVRLLGYKEAELIGQSIDIIFPGTIDIKGTKQKITDHLVKQGYVADYEIRLSNKSNHSLPVLFSGSVMRDKMGRVEGIVAIAKDITDRKVSQSLIELKNKMLEKVNEDLVTNHKALNTMLTDLRRSNEELKKAQNQLVQSEKLASIGQLAAGIAHEINNPLGFVGSNLSVLDQYIHSLLEVSKMVELLKKAIEEKNLDEAVRVNRQIINLEKTSNIEHILSDINNLLQETHNGIERIRLIVKDLKAFARQDKEVKAPFNLNKIFEGVLNIVWSEIKYKADLKQELGEIPLVECNGQQIGQVFINLLVNATQAIQGRGVITVRTYAKDDFVYAEITDTGEGIPANIIDKIFDPFFSTKDVSKGTGLGLSISYEIVKNHNGDIKVISEVGRGTTFIVSFPAIIGESLDKKVDS